MEAMQLRSRFSVGLLVMIPAIAMAQNPNLIPENGLLAPGCNFITGEFGFHCVPIYIGMLMKILFGFAAGIALTEIIYSGYQIAFGGLQGGDTSGPRMRILYALLGLAVSVFAFAIIDTALLALTTPATPAS